jgi:hypothetical protein
VRITIYRRPDDYISQSFIPTELDTVKELCYINDINSYILTYTEEEWNEYERFSKRNN